MGWFLVIDDFLNNLANRIESSGLNLDDINLWDSSYGLK